MLHESIIEVFQEIGVKELHTKLVSICCDGVCVSLGKHCSALCRADSPWLVGIHCMNHCIELALKHAFAQSSVEEVINTLTAIHSTSERSSKRCSDLKYVAEILGE